MATAAAAIVARARRDVISHFMHLKAIDEASAVPFVPERFIESRMLQRFLNGGVVVETSPGTYYLDLPAYDHWSRNHRRRKLLLVGGAAALAAALALL